MNKYIKEAASYIIIIVVVVLIRTFLVTPIIVNGDSMDNTLKNGEVMLLNKIKPRLSGFKRFDIVVIKKDNSHIIKRIIGLPSETVTYIDGVLYINAKKVDDPYGGNFIIDDFTTTLGKNEFFVLGDNRPVSKDSRYKDVGHIKKSEILGTTKFILFPFNKIGLVK